MNNGESDESPKSRRQCRLMIDETCTTLCFTEMKVYSVIHMDVSFTDIE